MVSLIGVIAALAKMMHYLLRYLGSNPADSEPEKRGGRIQFKEFVK